MTNRKKIQLKKHPINSWSEADEVLKEIAIIETTITKEEAEYNRQEQERRQRLTAKHFPLRERLQELELGLEEFCILHKSELGDKKSKRLKHGEISFRLHPPAVTKNRGVTWAAVLDLVKASTKWAKKFIRIKEDINKDAIIAARQAGEISEQDLRTLGMTITQKETFGYKVNLAIEEEK